jgi:hypothetical protein
MEPICSLAALLLCLPSFGACTTPVSSSQAKTELIAENDFIEAGQSLWLGLQFQLESGWHIYWINPGDSGETPGLVWRFARFRTGSIQCPFRSASTTIRLWSGPAKKVDNKGGYMVYFDVFSVRTAGLRHGDEQNAYVKQVKASPDRCPA